METSSNYLNKAIEALAKLPGIGQKSALRLALFFLKQEPLFIENFCQALVNLKTNIRFCALCHHLSDSEICNICSNPNRNKTTICVVESIREVIAIENTNQYNGLYHVLGGIISPLDGIGPDQLQINSLLIRISELLPAEIIFALSPNIQGDTTIFYIQKLLQDFKGKITTISRGVSFGGDLEYVDELTLGRSIANRQSPQHYIQ